MCEICWCVFNREFIADFYPRALAVLGAFLVIFSLAFDTFAQQVLTTRTRPTNEIGSNNNGTSTPLPRSMAYLNQRDSSINSGGKESYLALGFPSDMS